MAQDATPADDWGRYRPYLHLLARLHLRDHPNPRAEPSDIVQQTMMEAHAGGFRGATEAERLAWLRRALANNLADAARVAFRAKRDADRERPLDEMLDRSSLRVGGWALAREPSPSEQGEAHERAARLAVALGELPEAQREALILQHWHGWTLAQIGAHLGKTPAAVAGLLKRGLRGLRDRLDGDESASG